MTAILGSLDFQIYSQVYINNFIISSLFPILNLKKEIKTNQDMNLNFDDMNKKDKKHFSHFLSFHFLFT